MDLEPNADEQQIIEATRGFLRGSLPASRLHGPDQGRVDRATLRDLSELGWYGLGLDEEAGGYGLTIVDEMLMFREIGRALGPLAVLGISLAAKVAAAAGLPDLVQTLLAGEHHVALAVADPNRRSTLLFDVDGADLALSLVDGEAQLIDLEHAVVESLPCLDKSVTLGRCAIERLPVLARVPGEPVEQVGQIMTAAMLVGICEATTDMITDYAKIRETFGKPIGSYQAVRHPCAEMAVRTFAARAQLFMAAVSLRDGRADCALQVQAAKALANESALVNVDDNIQLHGGIGTTDEHDAHLYMKRAGLLVRLFGRHAVADRILSLSRAA